MEAIEQLDEVLTCRLDFRRKAVEPCSIVIFGATGDLTARKLIPALFHLFIEKQLPNPFRIIGFARRPKTDAEFRGELFEALKKYSRTKDSDTQEDWQAFAANLGYCQGDISDAAGYQELGKRLAAFVDERLRRNLVFYLATLPSQFPEVVEHLHNSRLLHKGDGDQFWQRIVVEKPFGHDLNSAQKLNAELTRFAYEKQIYRIDHYLGKETVQNILMFRFSNAIFEELWTRRCIDHVQITVAEKQGVASRGPYYEEAGALRDMVQNHLLQVLALVAAEPPVSLEAECIRDEKVKVLNSIRQLDPSQVAANVVRGQYAAGQSNGRGQVAYRQEDRVNSASNTETFVALRVLIDNWRWSGVPFYLRTGKCLPVSASEVRVQFRPTPNVLFAAQCGPKLDANSITLRLQPHEGIFLRFNGKVPGIGTEIQPVRMHFDYNAAFGAYTPEAYERLLLDALAGDATLFIRRDEVEAAWSIVDPIREAWGKVPLGETDFYPAGTWGPETSDQLLARWGHRWHTPHEMPPEQAAARLKQ